MSPRLSVLFFGLVLLVGSAPASGGETSTSPVPARSLKDIQKNLMEILKPGDKEADEKTLAMRKLKAYRYLAEVPYADLILDDNLNKRCRAGAQLCETLGKLDHNPMNPGMPEAEFKFAYQGVRNSNLGWGHKNLVAAVDDWMFDSTPDNIDRLGHRRCCLNPAMQKTGFGQSGIFSAMHSLDNSRKDVPDYDFICFPARGYMPIEFFNPRQAWNVTLNPKKFKTPGKDYTPKIYRADALGEKTGEPLGLDFKNVYASSPAAIPVPNSIIFRPEKLDLGAKGIYVVELEDIVRQGSGQKVTLRYSVEFTTWK